LLVRTRGAVGLDARIVLGDLPGYNSA
jgi:hypothetical protein